MNGQTKTIADINAKLAAGEAVVMTAMELKARVRAGEKLTPAEVDVVTTATRAVMSGTAAMLSLPVGEEGTLPESIVLNGVPCLARFRTRGGFTPVLLNGTQESLDNHGRYGGGHVLRELVARGTVEVEWRIGGRGGRAGVTLEEMPSRFSTRAATATRIHGLHHVENAAAYRDHPTSIFACRPIPPLAGLAVSGSGEMNPRERTTPPVIRRNPGAGQRRRGHGRPATAPAPRPNRSAWPPWPNDGKDPQFMGGFRTSDGVEVTNSLAVPFAVTNQEILDNLMSCRDELLPHRIGDLADRLKLIEIRYADIWRDAPLEVRFDPERCICCSFQCEAEYYCPMGAISWKDKTIDQDLCVACGACTGNCQGGAFMGKGWAPRRGLGDVHIFDQEVPIIFRQSNRLRAERLARLLKERLLNRSFYLVDTDSKCVLWN